MRDMSEGTPPKYAGSTALMTRIELTPEEWAEVRKHAIDAGVATKQWIADVLRDKLKEVV